ncbi:hypothetical protein HYDPIDRAFT_112982 [Hydnomerulius pinastri MD-312]|uniref:Unplaced genomic scaffold scaffold_16, whole genome shotgun sequence n=1 Tax=Hydnomerulius pinastri MD-312 TaxID=994086 RepID=A0A0C9WE20_9AGAM|nr:hypothetical protein HYDPIDRAFT_112982 [Hydnomerulius pinastri MD-312]
MPPSYISTYRRREALSLSYFGLYFLDPPVSPQLPSGVLPSCPHHPSSVHCIAMLGIPLHAH